MRRRHLLPARLPGRAPPLNIKSGWRRRALGSSGSTQRWNRVANVRLVVFVAAAAAAAWGLWGRAQLGWVLAGLLLGLFVALAIYHSRLGWERRRLGILRSLQEEALARIERRWDDLPVPWEPPVPADHPYAADLDIIGHASLTQLLDTTATRMGRETLADWLLFATDAATATARQGAVADLAPRLDLRQEVELRGRAAADDETDPSPFLAWAEGPDTYAGRQWLRWVAWLSPAALIAFGWRIWRGSQTGRTGSCRCCSISPLAQRSGGTTTPPSPALPRRTGPLRPTPVRSSSWRRLISLTLPYGNSNQGWDPASMERRPCCAG